MSLQTRVQIYEDLKHQRRRGEMLDGRLADPRVTRIMEVQSLADLIFGDEAAAEEWLKRPNAAMSGQVPAELMKDDLGAAVVLETLQQIAHGIVP
jgi:putative toxin-antitoxin system antitoxin component (TIGR02293 family)